MRGFLIVSAMALAGCSGGSRSGLPFDAAIEALIPAGATMVAGAQVAAAMKSELLAPLFSGPLEHQLQEIRRATGLDPARDITEIVLASRSGKPPVAYARGKFDTAALQAKLKGEGFTAMGSLYRKDSAGVAFMDATTLAAGPLSELEESLGKRGMPEPMRELLAGIGGDAHLWAAVTEMPALKAPARSNLQNLEKVAGSLRSATLSVSLASGVSARIHGNCPSEEEAKKLQSGLKGMIGLGRLSTPDNKPELLKLWDGLRVDLDKSAVVARVDLAQAQVKELTALLGSR